MSDTNHTPAPSPDGGDAVINLDQFTRSEQRILEVLLDEGRVSTLDLARIVEKSVSNVTKLLHQINRKLPQIVDSSKSAESGTGPGAPGKLRWINESYVEALEDAFFAATDAPDDLINNFPALDYAEALTKRLLDESSDEHDRPYLVDRIDELLERAQSNVAALSQKGAQVSDQFQVTHDRLQMRLAEAKIDVKDTGKRYLIKVRDLVDGEATDVLPQIRDNARRVSHAFEGSSSSKLTEFASAIIGCAERDELVQERNEIGSAWSDMVFQRNVGQLVQTIARYAVNDADYAALGSRILAGLNRLGLPATAQFSQLADAASRTEDLPEPFRRDVSMAAQCNRPQGHLHGSNGLLSHGTIDTLREAYA